MKRIVMSMFVALLFSSPLASAQDLPRIAVMDFDYGTVRTTSAAFFDTNADLGQGIRDLVVDRLVNGGKYSVIERAIVDKVIKEQDFANSNRADERTASAIGRLAGVGVMLTGSITQLGRDDSSTSMGGGGSNRSGGGIWNRVKDAAGQARVSNATANVQITARLVATNTGAILSSVTGSGKASRRSVGAGGSGAGSGGGGFGVVDMKRSNFGDTLIGEATLAAVTDLVTRLEAEAVKVPAEELKIEGQVADVSGGTVTLTVGSRQGVKRGMVLTIMRTAREIRDLQDKVIRRIEDTLGSVTIADVGEDWAAGAFAGQGAVKRGDAARLTKR